MASQVLSGTSNVSYTNNTGQNVRIVINFMANVSNMTWAGTVTTSSTAAAGGIGRNLAFWYRGGASSAIGNNGWNNSDNDFCYPTEIMLSAGQTFSATCGAYNILIIPEAG